MGNDGGSIPDRRDLVKNKAKAEQPDKANQTRARWFFCALSKRPLEEPIASCPLGKLYNKDAVLEYLLDRNAYGDGEEICGHIKSLKDLKELKLTRNTGKSSVSDGTPNGVDGTARAPFMCPLNYKEMNGSQPFVCISTCGCVFSLSGLKAVSGAASPGNSDGQLDADVKGKEKEQNGDGKQLDMCPQCGAKYDRTADVVMLNPPPAEEEKMREAMERRRATEPQKTKGKKRKAKAQAAEGASDKPAEKKRKQGSPMPSTNPSMAAASRAVVQSLAEEEAKRKATMSQAVKSLYGPSTTGKETFMTMGTFTRYA
ncbi:Rtf2 RING-finger-domain-containing protein [Rhodofomes roseus]|uniref:Rtf2 RING-finger-domain-containing protein n=1 Tax=Rhodofomes roseus TaxID=34475 RepID=A0ABQ8KFV2_9APHY|nr:Rtf2 RING-finger-domain-containing protein [Rhodofomes roseus]KAH9836652.1 Rtf2 RING-finger-domain-containing protein [Rhodofomes roseus]